MNQPMRIFDRRLVRLRRERLATNLTGVGFLLHEVTDRLLDRLADIRREFRHVLVLGGTEALVTAVRARPGVVNVVLADEVAAMLMPGGSRVVVDTEALPFAEDRFELFVGVMLLHWVNDLPGTLAQMRYCLAPDGLLLLAMPGGDTLGELRQALTEAELECEGGAAPRVSPFADLRDAGGLLQRAGLALPVADVDRITVSYGDPLRLMRDLSRMGEANALLQRRQGPLRRATLARACQIYAERYADGTGRVPATFDILFLSAWKRHASQQQPARRGSGRTSLADAVRRAPPRADR